MLIPTSPATAARGCDTVRRPYTDASPIITVVRGPVRCANARGVMKRYWLSEVLAFRKTKTLRFAGIRWTCRPTGSGFPTRWRCTSRRSTVTARE